MFSASKGKKHEYIENNVYVSWSVSFSSWIRLLVATVTSRRGLKTAALGPAEEKVHL